MASAEAPVAVDGSLLEGGGQIVRVATALSAATGRDVLVENVRAGRPKPGLAAQHLAGLRLVRDACGGSLRAPDGGDVGVGATAFTLAPGSVKEAADASAAGDRASPGATGSSSSSERSERSAAAFAADVNTAGAISLVAQSFVPVAAFAGRVSRVSLTGGTDVPNAPPIGYLKHCLAPCLRAHLGIEIDAEVTRRGYFPRGGGEATLTVVPKGIATHASLSKHPYYPPFTIERSRPGRGGDGEPAKLGCWIVNGAPDGPRQQTESRAAAAAALRSLLTKSPTVAIAAEAMARAGVPVDCRTAVEPGSGDGGSVLLSAASVDGTCVLAVGLVFEPPRKSSTNDEKEHANARVKALVALASRAGEALGELVESGAAVDDHLLDQLIVFMALADGRGGKKSRVVARAPLSKHAETAIDVCRRVVGARFEVLEGKAGGVKEGLVAVECVGIGATVR